MDLKISLPNQEDFSPRILVIGVGGAGGNAVNNMINSGAIKVDFLAVNTDSQVLNKSLAKDKIQLGGELTHGLGAGANPDIGKRSAESDIDKLEDFLQGYHMCFITAGMGGGTGTGASPVIAAKAKEMNILTIGVVTKPFDFEGLKRCKIAQKGLTELQKYVDTLIVIPNQKLFLLANDHTTLAEAFAMADGVLSMGVKGITDLMIVPGLINLDFADLRTVMNEKGKAMMGTGWGEGDDKALEAARGAIANPLLDDISLQGATAAIVNITGGHDMKLKEVNDAASYIKEQIDENAQIIVGSTFDESLKNKMCVSIVATGIDKSVHGVMDNQNHDNKNNDDQGMDSFSHTSTKSEASANNPNSISTVQQKSSPKYNPWAVMTGHEDAQKSNVSREVAHEKDTCLAKDAVTSSEKNVTLTKNIPLQTEQSQGSSIFMSALRFVSKTLGLYNKDQRYYIDVDIKNNDRNSYNLRNNNVNTGSHKSRTIPDYFRKDY